VSNARAENENAPDRCWLDNLIVYASSPDENGGTITELRLRVTDPSQAASMHGLDISWQPETKTWCIESGGDLEITETATIDTSEGVVAEALDAMDTAKKRDTNVN